MYMATLVHGGHVSYCLYFSLDLGEHCWKIARFYWKGIEIDTAIPVPWAGNSNAPSSFYAYQTCMKRSRKSSAGSTVHVHVFAIGYTSFHFFFSSFFAEYTLNIRVNTVLLLLAYNYDHFYTRITLNCGLDCRAWLSGTLSLRVYVYVSCTCDKSVHGYSCV